MSAMPKDLMAGFIYYCMDEKEKAQQCFEKSIHLLREAVERYPNDPRYHSTLGIALAGIGNKEEALQQGKKAVALLPLSKNKAYGTSYIMDLAVIYAMTGNVHEACEQLEILLNMDSWFTTQYFHMDIRLAPLYGKPEYEALMKKYEVKDL
jgi:tetratricopeptide (TPR) repeat protein